jgi:hypothetical protein
MCAWRSQACSRHGDEPEGARDAEALHWAGGKGLASGGQPAMGFATKKVDPRVKRGGEGIEQRCV